MTEHQTDDEIALTFVETIPDHFWKKIIRFDNYWDLESKIAFITKTSHVSSTHRFISRLLLLLYGEPEAPLESSWEDLELFIHRDKTFTLWLRSLMDIEEIVYAKRSNVPIVKQIVSSYRKPIILEKEYPFAFFVFLRLHGLLFFSEDHVQKTTE